MPTSLALPTANPSFGNIIFLEAEDCLIVGGLTSSYRVNQTPPNTEYYVEPSAHTWSKELAGSLICKFDVPTAGDYIVRIRFRTDAVAASVWVDLDGAEGAAGNVLTNRLDLPSVDVDGWRWSDGGGRVLTLGVGEHCLSFTSIHQNLKIGKIALIPVASDSIVPQNSGSAFSGKVRYKDFPSGLIASPPADSTLVFNTTSPLVQYQKGYVRIVFNENGSSETRNKHISVGTDANPTLYHESTKGYNVSATLLVESLFPINGEKLLVRYSRVNVDTSLELIQEFYIYAPNPEADKDYADWAVREANDPYRMLLVELDHQTGTVRLASQPWFNNSNNTEHDDFLTAAPYIEHSLLSEIDVGDVEAINPVLHENWLDNEWYGHNCRFLYGDSRWGYDKFVPIANAIVEVCRTTSSRKYLFELVGNIEKLNSSFHTGADVVRNENIDTAIKWILDQVGSTVFRYVNLGETELFVTVSYKVTELSTVLSLIRTICAGVGAYPVVNEHGVLEIIKPDEKNITLSIGESNIVRDTVNVVEIIKPVKTVTVEYSDATTADTLTQSADAAPSTGVFDESATIQTVLNNVADVNNLLATATDKYSRTQYIYEIELIAIGNIAKIGDGININHPDLNGRGVIHKVKNETLSKINTIEVLI